MKTSQLDTLHAFIIRAKQATYAGNGQKLLPPYRLDSRALQFTEGEWAYHDSYLGENDFIGQVAVYHREKVVWTMSYFGRILNPLGISSDEAGTIIRASLSKMYTERRFLGGFEHTEGDLTYTDTNDGDLQLFTGREQIRRKAEIVYELTYQGGLIKE